MKHNPTMYVAALLIVTPALLTGCNTIKGLGTDLHDMAQNTQIFMEESTGYTTDARSPSPDSPTRNLNTASASAK